MKALKAILLYVMSVMVISALLAPLIYNFAQAITMDGGLIDWIQSYDFARYFRRTVMVVAFLLLPVFLIRLGVRSWADIGLTAEIEKGQRFVWGFVFGLVSIFALGAVHIATNGRQFRDLGNAGELLGDIALAFGVAVLVSGLEEVFFRGVILNQIRKASGKWVALVLSSLIYAAVHFLRAGPDWGSRIITPLSGFELIPDMFQGFSSPRDIAIQFTTLFLAGMLLGYAYLRKGSLYLCIGIHAGWIFAMKLNAALTDNAAGQIWWLHGHGLDTGLLAVIMLLIFWGGLVLYENRRGNQIRF